MGSRQNPQRVPSTRHTEHSWLPERFVSLPPKTPRSPRFFFAAHPCTKGRAHAAAVKGKVPVGNAYARMGGHAQVGTEALQGARMHGRTDRPTDRSTDQWADKRAHGQMDASPPSVPSSETPPEQKDDVWKLLRQAGARSSTNESQRTRSVTRTHARTAAHARKASTLIHARKQARPSTLASKYLREMRLKPFYAL